MAHRAIPQPPGGRGWFQRCFLRLAHGLHRRRQLHQQRRYQLHTGGTLEWHQMEHPAHAEPRRGVRDHARQRGLPSASLMHRGRGLRRERDRTRTADPRPAMARHRARPPAFYPGIACRHRVCRAPGRARQAALGSFKCLAGSHQPEHGTESPDSTRLDQAAALVPAAGLTARAAVRPSVPLPVRSSGKPQATAVTRGPMPAPITWDDAGHKQCNRSLPSWSSSGRRVSILRSAVLPTTNSTGSG